MKSKNKRTKRNIIIYITWIIDDRFVQMSCFTIILVFNIYIKIIINNYFCIINILLYVYIIFFLFVFQNSFFVTFLSFCDYYRPKYIILENVDKCVNFKCGLILKLTIRSLIDMGYQCSFGILQDADFGIASSVKR